MAHMVLDCPHCGSNKITFDVIGDSPIKNMLRDFVICWNVFLKCRHCQKGVVAILASRDRQLIPPSSFSGNPLNDENFLFRIYPEQQKPTTPEYLSEAIRKDFEEAVDNLKGGRYTSAGMMFRRVLQRSTTALIDNTSTLKSKTLKLRVDILAEQGIITEAMRDWTDIIRLEGNSANHDEEEFGQDEFTAEDADQLHRFTELFLIYAFTLPARVKQYHEQSTPSAETSGA